MSSKTRRDREKERRKREITDAAERLFFSNGYDSVTMDDVADAVDLTKAAIYRYYENKEALYYSIVLRGMKILDELVKEKVQAGKNGIVKVHGIWQAYLEFAKGHPEFYRAYALFLSGRFRLDAMVNLDALGKPIESSVTATGIVNIPNSEHVKEILDVHLEIFNALVTSINEGISDETIEVEADPADVAAAILILMENSARISLTVRNDMEIHGISQQRFEKSVSCILDQIAMKSDH